MTSNHQKFLRSSSSLKFQHKTAYYADDVTLSEYVKKWCDMLIGQVNDTLFTFTKLERAVKLEVLYGQLDIVVLSWLSFMGFAAA
jgi:hypothetical protein